MIVTFYSYKGGTGRTMAVANVACLLAKAGRRVLVVDFDLEAPGIWRYFDTFQRGLDRRSGLMDLLLEAVAVTEFMPGSVRPSWRKYATPVRVSAQSVTLMTSGVQDEEYPARVLGFDWGDFFANRGGGEFFERLRAEWNSEYDFVLIDSRTGITDIGGICTILLPDMIVPVFTANWQNLEGVVDTLGRAQRGRQELAYDRSPALVLPVLSRFESRTELESANEWLSRAASMLADCYADWLPKDIDPRHMLERTKLPHIAYFGFGERLAVQLQGTTDPESLGYAYSAVARLIDSHLKDAREVVAGTETPRASAAVEQRLEPSAAPWIAAIYANDYSSGANVVVGSGLVIDSERVLVGTRVLQGSDQHVVGFSLPRAGDRSVRAEILGFREQTPVGNGHVSILHLERPLPSSVGFAPLGFTGSQDLVGRRWWAFGFPAGDLLGAEANGTIGASLAYGSVRLDGGRRSFWDPGVVGAPVWSPDHGAVVAVIVSVHPDGYGAATTLAEIAAELPAAGLENLAVPSQGAGLDGQQRESFINALAMVFNNPDRVRVLLQQLRMNRAAIPDFAAYSSPRLYWAAIITELENGVVPDGVSELARMALSLYPANRVFRETIDSLRATPPPSG
jgi:cellulose biosynthesis protein BcsQ